MGFMHNRTMSAVLGSMMMLALAACSGPLAGFDHRVLAEDCPDQPGTECWLIDNHTVPCASLTPQECMLVLEDGDAAWSMAPDTIEGFTYTPGYVYTLRVRVEEKVEPLEDGSTRRVFLVEEIGKNFVPLP